MAGLLPHEAGRCIAPAAMAETPSEPPLRLDRPIVLVGLMGVGKSTVGRRLAKRLGLPFVDSDDEIERAADHSISEIFERFGEASFRDGEQRVIRRLVDGPPAVLATGGGAFIEPATRALILERCIAVWLDAEVETLAERVRRRNARPLLGDKDPLPRLRELAAARNPVYAEAHLHVRSEDVSQEAAVERIVEALAERERAA
ncbi:MAG: shikimate kinase [Sphingomonadales bacterium]|jgi:shikimate kinase|nr:shikimate kinase [Sphingomonadales bacterium]